MPFRILDQGIRAIQAENIVEGARLLRIALKNEALTGNLRAVAWMWLAETQHDHEFKRDCYNEALAADPGNEDVRQRMAILLSTQLPPTAPSAAPSAPEMPPIRSAPTPPPQQPYPISGQPPAQGQPSPYMPPSAAVSGQPPAYAPQSADPIAPQPLGSSQPQPQSDFFRTVGLVGGPNGTGTGFFVKHTGLVVTTRYVVGSSENMTAALDDGRHLPGYPVRAFPQYDLAMVQITMNVPNLLPVSQRQQIFENERLTAISHNGQVMSGQRRATRRQLPSHWFPTTIDKMEDAGGNPVFNESNHLVGMLTKNTSRSNKYVYGLHITIILQCVDVFMAELAQDRNRAYCPTCGYASRAISIGAFYCEACGGVLPYARSKPRFPLSHTADLYGDNLYPPCNQCGSRVGYYKNTCLRCGSSTSTRSNRLYPR